MSQSKLKQVFSYQSWVHAVSGSAGSVIAMSAFYPLDTVRSRLQLEEPERRKALSTWRILRNLIDEEGFETLYRGLVPVLESLCISNFVYFYTFHSLKALRGGGQSALGDLLLGSLAGVVNVLTTTPCWVVNTRLKMKGLGQQAKRNGSGGTDVQYDGLLDGLQYIARTEGVRGLWAGAVPSLMLVINPAIQFMVYEALKRRLTAGGTSRTPSAITFFSIGAIAKMIATVLTYPLQLVQTKLRHGNTDRNLNVPPDVDTVQMLLIILKRQGVAGLFRGLEAKLLQTVLTAALMFMAYEKIARFVTSLLLSKGGVTAVRH
ncbi:peroxisomal membrane protein PMP34 [Anopheles moucheti]|uniref:peroxisomal membrane protein PMP34 n=1 Tax=Anopheles moucheti TaxID=186751 RepID=UPI0022EFE234|nr:peroxisomal membrane protein PMP34 [Anopheles moucheti]XP_052894939.1 peroxisomal membrane protein PMP34 [Anopheles moucheti]XP_052894940.1 peroxisomal membrane protein PMP34 [Anopheles moucheti]XP_052894941.1 peroxisomal membrane protein PMP34 [Anopheles moucheti]